MARRALRLYFQKRYLAAGALARRALDMGMRSYEEGLDEERAFMKEIAPGAKAQYAWQVLQAIGLGLVPKDAVKKFPALMFGPELMEVHLPPVGARNGMPAPVLWAPLSERTDVEAVDRLVERETALCTDTSDAYPKTKAAYQFGSWAAKGEWLDILHPQDEGRYEVEPLVVTLDGEKVWTAPQLPPGFARHQAKRVKARYWSLHPWCFGDCGEARIELENGRHVRAIMTFYAHDAQQTMRGRTMLTRFALFANGIRKDIEHRELTTPEERRCVIGKDFRYLSTCVGQEERRFSEAMYEGRGEVVEVAEVSGRGMTGLLRFTVQFRDDVLPFPLDVYTQRAHVAGAMPRVGDMVSFQGWLYANQTTPVDDYDTWERKALETGNPVPEHEWQPGDPEGPSHWVD